MHSVDVQPPLLQGYIHFGFRARTQGLCHYERLHILRRDNHVLSVSAVSKLSHGRSEYHDILTADCPLLLLEAGKTANVVGCWNVMLCNRNNSSIYQHDGSWINLKRCKDTVQEIQH